MFKSKQYISLFFLVVFAFLKTSSLHALSHSDNDFNIDDCDICEFVVTSNDTPFTTDIQIEVTPIVIQNFNNQTSFYYNYLFSKNQLDSSLFCRPPPTL